MSACSPSTCWIAGIPRQNPNARFSIGSCLPAGSREVAQRGRWAARGLNLARTPVASGAVASHTRSSGKSRGYPVAVNPTNFRDKGRDMSQYAVIDPATGDVVQEYPTATDEQMEQALAAAA